MEPSPVAFDQNPSGAADDFPALLRRKGLLAPAAIVNPALHGGTPHQKSWQPTEATTILAFKFSGGVLVAGDRRATAGNTVVYDRADKVLEIDRHSIMAIAGVPATAWEMARVLEHSFQYFRRTQLQEMSVDGKVRALSKLLRDNFGFVMQGVGVLGPHFGRDDLAAYQDRFARRHRHFAREQNRCRVQRNGCMIEEPYRWVEAIANRREYIEAQLASGSPIAALGYRDGILFLTLGQRRQKIFE